jgi:hypothetical protein
VVIDGADRLREGARVSAKDETPDAATPARATQAGGPAGAPAASGTGADQPAHAHHSQQNGT